VAYLADRIQKEKLAEDPVSARLNVNVIANLDAAPIIAIRQSDVAPTGRSDQRIAH
jgi:hypothetical protein